MFLTTNRVRVFDDAIQSRVTLASTRKSCPGCTAPRLTERQNASPKTSDQLAQKDLIVSNLLALTNLIDQKTWSLGAHALAVYHNTKVCMSHLELVTGLNKEFASDFGGAASNKNSFL